MNDMPIFQPQPMFEETTKNPAPPRKKRTSRRAASAEPTEPKGPKKPKEKPRKKRRVVRKEPARANGKPGIELIASAVAGLNEDQVTVLLETVKLFGSLKPAGKTRVAASLAKLYS